MQGTGGDAHASGGVGGADAPIDDRKNSGGSGGIGASADGSSSDAEAGHDSGDSGGTTGNAFLNCSPASGVPPVLKLTEVAGGFVYPLIAESPPNDTARLFVGEQGGVIYVMKNGIKLGMPFLDITDRVQFSGEEGLLGLAFHPQYSQNGRFYVHYTSNDKTAPFGWTVVSEFTRSSSDLETADPLSEKVVLIVGQPESNHNGGGLHFGPDSTLYLGLGDGGGGGDQHGTIGYGQALDVLLGKILRIDIDSPANGKNYGIPSGNMTGSGVREEIWSYGLRNPWRWSFDGCTGDMYIGDVGEDSEEEIDVEPIGTGSGRNYGWRVMEGSLCYNPPVNCNTSGKTLPVAEYDHGYGCAVVGGYVYRGSAMPGLRGWYVYADFCSGRFWRFRYFGGQAKDVTEITSSVNPTLMLGISSLGQDAMGEIWVTRFNDTDGKLYRVDSQ